MPYRNKVGTNRSLQAITGLPGAVYYGKGYARRFGARLRGSYSAETPRRILSIYGSLWRRCSANFPRVHRCVIGCTVVMDGAFGSSTKSPSPASGESGRLQYSGCSSAVALISRNRFRRSLHHSCAIAGGCQASTGRFPSATLDENERTHIQLICLK